MATTFGAVNPRLRPGRGRDASETTLLVGAGDDESSTSRGAASKNTGCCGMPLGVSIFLGILAGALVVTALALAITAVSRQDNGFSTPSLRVNRLAIGQEVPFARRDARPRAEPMLTVSGTTSISGDLEVSGNLRMASDQSGTTLSTEKTAQGYFRMVRTYAWTAEKVATTPNVTIEKLQCATLGYEVSGTRSLASEVPIYGMTGTVTITNGGDEATEQLRAVDTLEQNCGGGGGFQLFRGPFEIDLSAQPVIAANTAHVYTYDIELPAGTMIDPNCTYRNVVDVTIVNHSGWKPGGNNCPGPALCPFGPQFRVETAFPVEPAIEEVHEQAKVTDMATCPIGFTCAPMPEGDIQLPTEDVCSFDGMFYLCQLFTEVCNTGALCGSVYEASDFVQLVSINEPAAGPLVVNSNTVMVDVHSGQCAPPPGGDNCTRTIGYWKTHGGTRGRNPDDITERLPLSLGCPQTGVPAYSQGIVVTSASQAISILTPNRLRGGARNGLNKAAAQLLAAKLNVWNTDISVAAVADADSLLCSYGFNAGAWDTLGRQARSAINNAASDLDAFNNGQAGVPRCE